MPDLLCMSKVFMSVYVCVCVWVCSFLSICILLLLCIVFDKMNQSTPKKKIIKFRNSLAIRRRTGKILEKCFKFFFPTHSYSYTYTQNFGIALTILKELVLVLLLLLFIRVCVCFIALIALILMESRIFDFTFLQYTLTHNPEKYFHAISMGTKLFYFFFLFSLREKSTEKRISLTR